MILVPVCTIFCVDYETAIKKLFWKSEFLGFTGCVFKDCSLKSARQAPAATAWEKKKQRVNEQRVNEQRVNEQHVGEHK